MNIRFETTGCRLNQIESESAARSFLDNGWQTSLKPLNAKSEIDEETVLAVINTCAVTQKAEQKDRRIIRMVLEKCPRACVVVTGCYAQLAAQEIRKISPRIAVLPGQVKARISEVPALLRSNCISAESFDSEKFAVLAEQNIFNRPAAKSGYSENAFKLATDTFQAHSRSSIKIQDGCNCACTYCTIHIARGKSVSLAAEKVLERVVALEKAGQSEVVITTVNIGHYKGAYKDGFVNFTQLLKLCLEWTSKINFRISSLYPEIVDDEFCRVISDPRVRPHFHISVQSGSDAVLRKMARAYKAQDVIDACNRLKKAKKNPFLACDIITGFPGETDADFEQTMELCRACDFAWVHVFPFSARPGTPAAAMRPMVPQSVSGERAAKLSAWASENKRKYIELCRGSVFDAVLENAGNAKIVALNASTKIYHAVTENFLHCEVKIPAAENPVQGKSVKIRILGQKPDLSKGGEADCIGELVSGQGF